MSLKEEIIELIEKSVIESTSNDFFRKPIVGFSSADNPLYKELKNIIGPEHLHPREFLPNANSLISFFIPFSENVVNSNNINMRVSRKWAESYIEANNLINHISEELIDLLKNKNIEAVTIKATGTYDEKNIKSSWSHRSAAFIANMGKFGVNRMFITKAGCAGRFGTVILSEEIPIEPEEINGEYCLYYKGKDCLICIKSCPENALSLGGFDRFKCREHLVEVAEEFTELGVCRVCGKCVVSCPVATGVK